MDLIMWTNIVLLFVLKNISAYFKGHLRNWSTNLHHNITMMAERESIYKVSIGPISKPDYIRIAFNICRASNLHNMTRECHRWENKSVDPKKSRGS